MKKRIVIALGGNALGNDPASQIIATKATAKPIVDLIEQGNEVIIAHGNGPQVGTIILATETAANSDAKTPIIPMPECGAMSQGYIGYHIQNAIREELLSRNIKMPVATIVTQVVVDKNDPAFKNPTKPIGSFYSKEQAEALEKEKGYAMKEDAGRGYRRVVPSPLPIDIVEKETINALVDADQVVITVGGGGIPVVAEGNALKGVDSVIDKDFASSVLADLIDADYLIILTAVEKVAINYGKPNEEWLDELSIEKAKQYCGEGHFAPGSMLPKIQAAMKFVEGKAGRSALITLLEKAKDGIDGKTGTRIVN